MDALQQFVLDRSGDEVFWAPFVLIFLAIFAVWAASSYRGWKILGWFLGTVLALGAAGVWFFLWDWRADQYEQEFVQHVSSLQLSGTEVTEDDISAEYDGTIVVDMAMDYEFGYSSTFLINDVSDVVDHLVVDYHIPQEYSGQTSSYIETMRPFQNIRFDVEVPNPDPEEDEEEFYVRDSIVYEQRSLELHAMETNLQEHPEPSEETIGETNYSVIETGSQSAWEARDEQASEDGVSVDISQMFSDAPEFLEQVNAASCAMLNGFEECDEGEPGNHHSVYALIILVVVVLVLVGVLEFLLRKIRLRRGDEGAGDAEERGAYEYDDHFTDDGEHSEYFTDDSADYSEHGAGTEAGTEYDEDFEDTDELPAVDADGDGSGSGGSSVRGDRWI